MADKVSKFIFPVKTGNTVNNKEFELPSGGSYVDELPYGLNYGQSVILNNEIHILGSINNPKNHYKWNGTSWVSVSTLPYDFFDSVAVVYNNEIHILGGESGTYHYKWNGSSWTSVSTLPYYFIGGSAVVYNNEIHILGSESGDDNETNHYKWNGSSWVSVSTLPYNFFGGSAVVYNNEIHILGGARSRTNHYKWNGTSWVSVSTLPYNFYGSEAVVLNNEIHILGGSGDGTKHYKWNGTSWVSVSTLPYDFNNGSAVVHNNEIHILGGHDLYGGEDRTDHYRWTGTVWTNEFDKYAPINHNHDDRYYTKDDKLPTVDVIDNLNSGSSTDALSAKQGNVLKGLIDSMSESDYYRRYVNDWGENSINFIDNTSGKIMFTLTGVLTLKDDILTFDGAMLGTTNDYKGGRILNYTADLSSTFTKLSNYEWDTGWIADNSIVPDDGACMGWCIIFNEGCDTPIDYVSGNGLKVRITHVMGFDESGYIKPDFLHFSAKIKPKTT